MTLHESQRLVLFLSALWFVACRGERIVSHPLPLAACTVSNNNTWNISNNVAAEQRSAPLRLTVHIIFDDSSARIDPLLINRVYLLRRDNVSSSVDVALVGQLFVATQLRIVASWGRDWRVANRFVIRGTLDLPSPPRSLAQLFGALLVSVRMTDYFTIPKREYAKVVGYSPARRLATGAQFCLSTPADSDDDRPVPPSAVRRPYSVAVCSVFRNEAANLREWIAWHQLFGVEHFFLYDDSSSDEWRVVLQPLIEKGVVTVHRWHEHNYWRQLTAINDCLLRHRLSVTWLLVLDVDEFVFASAARARRVSLAKLLASAPYSSAAAVRLAWWQFSDRTEPLTASDIAPLRYEWRSERALLGSVTLLNDTARGGEPVRIVAGKALVRAAAATGYDLSHMATLRDDVPPLAVLDADPSKLAVRHYAMRDIGGRNRWTDTKTWKQAHRDELRRVFGAVHDTAARYMGAQTTVQMKTW